MMNWDNLAAGLLSGAGDRVAEQGHPTWVRVLDSPNGDHERIALAFSEDPDGLIGWVATPDCQAVGVVATGRIRALEGAPPGLVVPTRNHIRMACVVARDGQVAWKTSVPDGLPADQPPAEGRMLDCLRRCFGLATPPPPAPPGRLQVVVWLAAVLEEATTARRPLSWSEVGRLHPVAQVLGAELVGSRMPLVPGLMRMAGSAWSWEDFRLQAQRESGLQDVVDPDLAGWMDDGMFARWVLSDLPSPDELLTALRPHLSPSAARRLSHAVRAADLPEGAEAGAGAAG
jgi:hypothetical protein